MIMLESIKGYSFQNFGAVVSSTPAHSEQTMIVSDINNSEADFYCFHNSEVYLERINGMPILSVLSDNIKKIHKFYLDWPVVLNKGVWHKIITTYDDDCVRRSY